LVQQQMMIKIKMRGQMLTTTIIMMKAFVSSCILKERKKNVMTAAATYCTNDI